MRPPLEPDPGHAGEGIGTFDLLSDYTVTIRIARNARLTFPRAATEAEAIEIDLSILLARIIGPIFVVAGLGSLINPAHYRRLVHDFFANGPLIYFSGVLALLMGLIMIEIHNLWVADWRVIITVIGWLSLIKGVIRIVLPGRGTRVARAFNEGAHVLTISASAMLALGAILTYAGYVG